MSLPTRLGHHLSSTNATPVTCSNIDSPLPKHSLVKSAIPRLLKHAGLYGAGHNHRRAGSASDRCLGALSFPPHAGGQQNPYTCSSTARAPTRRLPQSAPRPSRRTKQRRRLSQHGQSSALSPASCLPRITLANCPATRSRFALIQTQTSLARMANHRRPPPVRNRSPPRSIHNFRETYYCFDRPRSINMQYLRDAIHPPISQLPS
jgi:hypothetical protein